jgi:D-arginine dehydrogenase
MGQVVVIGAGIAGVATAAALAVRGRAVTLLERERLAGTGSTGLNAAIYRLAVAEPENVELALRARAIGARLVPGGTVRATGAYYRCRDEAERDAILRASAHAGVREVARDAAIGPGRGPMLFSPEDGVIDAHALVQALLREANAHGAQLRFGVGVAALERTAGRVTAVRTDDGAHLEAEIVVDATGPWSPGLAPDSDVGIRPHRRHLFQLDLDEGAMPRCAPAVMWDLDAGYYLRPESGGLLASACDETAMAAHAGDDVVPTDPDVAGVLFEKLSAAHPPLATARVRRSWAGLRPLTADHRFVVGPDPRIPGLFRAGGLGGHGMTAGAAAGEVAAALLCGETHAMATALDPGRGSLGANGAPR